MTDDLVSREVAALRPHWAYEPLRAAWAAAHDRQQIQRLLGPLHEPGHLVLRCRFRHLLDPGRPDLPEGLLTVDDELWHRLLVLETQADAHLRLGPSAADRAETDLRELLELEYQPAHRVVTVNAVHGLAEVARHADDRETAVELFGHAVELARADGYRFGEARALVSLGYLTLTVSVTGAVAHFEVAEHVAENVGDRLYAANAALGIAECWQRTRNWEAAAERAEHALAVFTAIRSPIGIGNAAARLADILSHTPGADRARIKALLAHAAEAYADLNPIGRISVLDELGDLAQQDGDIKTAVAHHRRAYELAVTEKYPRGKANGLAGLAAAGRAAGTWTVADKLGGAALTAFRELGDPLGEVNALEGLAMCATALGNRPRALHMRYAAVRTIEGMRADIHRHNLQAEYRSRFEPTYRRAAEAGVEADDPSALLWLLECLAGRRLAGLVDQATGGLPAARAHEVAELTSSADSLWQDIGPDHWAARRTRVAGKIAATVTAPPGTAIQEAIAALYLPPPDSLAPLLEALPPRCETVVVDVGLLGADSAVWVRIDSEGGLTCGSESVEGLGKLLSRLADQTAQQLTLAELAPLGHLLPPALNAAVLTRECARVLVVPIGDARIVPWTAVPIEPDGPTVLGECVEIAVCPSLTVQRALRVRQRERDSWPTRPKVGIWRDPALVAHRVTAFDIDDSVVVDHVQDSAAALTDLREAQHDLLVVAVHGRRHADGMTIALDERTRLKQSDCLDARPPRRIGLIACWGGHVETTGIDSEPVTMASLLVAAGSEWVMATTAELADATIATRFVERTLVTAAHSTPPSAVLATLRTLLAKRTRRTGLIKYWAPLQVFGTFYTS